ncbi:MAG TPA: T9SS type A sorting domain-containing protein, partial [Ignavibacteriaceae bacterium]|nr:T9SS type A sorting domain-containing protein [Ignavibacteriaceae bacterium]
IVFTPFGTIQQSNLIRVPQNSQIWISDSLFLINSNSSSKVIAKANDFKYIFKSSHKARLTNNFLNVELGNGLITHAYGQVLMTDPVITCYSTEWIVPDPPSQKGKQIIYIFNALTTLNDIVQPVLQWGDSPAGGGDYWAICNWYVTRSGNAIFDTLIKVNSGTRLHGEINVIQQSNGLFSYRIGFKGFNSFMQINDLPLINIPIEALEAYNIQSCNEYPADEKIKMGNINIKVDSINPEMRWYSYDDKDNPANDCGQYTNIVWESSINGQVDIHFHTPYSVDNYQEIHFYPNPVKDFLHIAPNYLDDPISLFPGRIITDCKIEIVDLNGHILDVHYYPALDEEFDLDLSKLTAGIYVIVFSYSGDSHAFKIIKK